MRAANGWAFFRLASCSAWKRSVVFLRELTMAVPGAYSVGESKNGNGHKKHKNARKVLHSLSLCLLCFLWPIEAVSVIASPQEDEARQLLNPAINRDDLLGALDGYFQGDRDMPSACRFADPERRIDLGRHGIANRGHGASHKTLLAAADNFEKVRPGKTVRGFQEFDCGEVLHERA